MRKVLYDWKEVRVKNLLGYHLYHPLNKEIDIMIECYPNDNHNHVFGNTYYITSSIDFDIAFGICYPYPNSIVHSLDEAKKIAEEFVLDNGFKIISNDMGIYE